ncbi:hypothetical protein DFH06DRAFT_1144039 [Mycena polygramma]|nr:hypothetical protein DFH06DRAFT_1144039 [Mycena polygramma]
MVLPFAPSLLSCSPCPSSLPFGHNSSPNPLKRPPGTFNPPRSEQNKSPNEKTAFIPRVGLLGSQQNLSGAESLTSNRKSMPNPRHQVPAHICRNRGAIGLAIQAIEAPDHHDQSKSNLEGGNKKKKGGRLATKVGAGKLAPVLPPVRVGVDSSMRSGSRTRVAIFYVGMEPAAHGADRAAAATLLWHGDVVRTLFHILSLHPGSHILHRSAAHTWMHSTTSIPAGAGSRTLNAVIPCANDPDAAQSRVPARANSAPAEDYACIRVERSKVTEAQSTVSLSPRARGMRALARKHMSTKHPPPPLLLFLSPFHSPKAESKAVES